MMLLQLEGLLKQIQHSQHPGPRLRGFEANNSLSLLWPSTDKVLYIKEIASRAREKGK